MPLPSSKQTYTYADYAAWDTDERYELFAGTPVMQARPSVLHQSVQAAILFQLMQFLADKPCRALTEIEVLLPDTDQQKAEDVTNVFVPDLVVICDPEQLTDQHCLGAPDVIFEILSPSTARADRFVKLNAYQRAGVREYWLVSPLEQTVQVFSLTDGLFTPSDIFTPGQPIVSGVLPGFVLSTTNLFAQ